MWSGERAIFLAVSTGCLDCRHRKRFICRLACVRKKPGCIPQPAYKTLGRVKLFRCIALIGVRSLSLSLPERGSCAHGFIKSKSSVLPDEQNAIRQSSLRNIKLRRTTFLVAFAFVGFASAALSECVIYFAVFLVFPDPPVNTPPHQPTKTHHRTSILVFPSQPVSEVAWPSLLKNLTFGHRFDPSSLNGLVWPEGLKAIQLGRVSRAVNDDRRIHPWGAWDEPEG